jgi:hypothetical protein
VDERQGAGVRTEVRGAGDGQGIPGLAEEVPDPLRLAQRFGRDEHRMRRGNGRQARPGDGEPLPGAAALAHRQAKSVGREDSRSGRCGQVRRTGVLVTLRWGNPSCGRGVLRDFTVAAQLTAQNGPGVHQWAFGAAAEAWALPGSRSILVGVESAVINEEPTNLYPKIAVNAVMKNRADGGVDPGAAMNANSVAVWVSAQPGTGFERGLVFDRDALHMEAGRPAALDLSDIPDDRIGEIDLIRIRKGVSLRYDPASRRLVLHVAPTEGGAPGPCLRRCIGDPAPQ